MLISNLYGPLGEEALTWELVEDSAPDGVEKYLNFLKERLNIQKLDMETYEFQKHLHEMMGRRRKTLEEHRNAEEITYRRLRQALEETTRGDEDESKHKEKQQSSSSSSVLVRTTEGLRTDNLEKGMNEPYQDRALKDTDEPVPRSSSVPTKEREPPRIENITTDLLPLWP